MASSEMLRRVALVRTDVSEELSSSFIRVTRISELGTTLAVISNRHRRENLKSYTLFICFLLIILYEGEQLCRSSIRGFLQS
jgi:hypothetical protein